MSEVENTVAVEVAVPKTLKGKKNVTNVKFATVWEKYAALARAGKCDNPKQKIADELGLEVSTVSQRSSAMRNPKPNAKGFTPAAIMLSNLPKGGGGRTTDASEAADLLAQLQADAAAAVAGESEVSDESEGESVEVEAGELVEASA